MNTLREERFLVQQSRYIKSYLRRALFFLCFCWFALGFSACSQPPLAPTFVEGEALPTSQPQAGKPVALSVRLIERIEKSPGVSSTGPLHFGSAIALQGDTLAVGAPENTAMPGHQKGIVYLYQREGDQWAETSALTASDEADGFQADLLFGSALGLDADTLAVGAPGADYDAGAVYIFQRRGRAWEATGILYASDSTAGARFGQRLVLQEDTLVVQGGQAVYVFERAGEVWVEQVRLTGKDLDERDRFGHSLALDGDYLAVRVVEYDPQLERYSSSTVYLFWRAGDRWVQDAQLAPVEEVGSGFGYSLALEGETLAVSASDDAAGFLAGAVYIYENKPEGWTQQAKLVPGDASFAYFTSFGSAIALQGDLLVVGASADSSQGLWAGSAYMFRRQGDTWLDMLKLWPVEADYLGAFFGAALELSGNTLLLAAPAEFGNAVYVYEISMAGN
jgi:hypothetical protein